MTKTCNVAIANITAADQTLSATRTPTAILMVFIIMAKISYGTKLANCALGAFSFACT
jgi:hypothetical protein